MSKKGYKQTIEHRMRIGKANKGKKRTKETRKKLSLSHLGKPSSKGMLGKHHTEEYKKEMKEIMKKQWKLGVRKDKFHNTGRTHWKKGRHISKSTEFQRGMIPWNKDKHFVENWFEPYSVDWTKTLRRSIRERDNYVCQLCGKLQSDKAFDVHHIDYDKKNCNPMNLVTLCRKCHIKTNFNRNRWIQYFNNLLDK